MPSFSKTVNETVKSIFVHICVTKNFLLITHIQTFPLKMSKDYHVTPLAWMLFTSTFFIYMWILIKIKPERHKHMNLVPFILLTSPCLFLSFFLSVGVCIGVLGSERVCVTWVLSLCLWSLLWGFGAQTAPEEKAAATQPPTPFSFYSSAIFPPQPKALIPRVTKYPLHPHLNLHLPPFTPDLCLSSGLWMAVFSKACG